MILILFYIILLFEIINGIWCLYRVIRYNNHNKKLKENSNESKLENSKILIVIPCLREQDIIISTLQHFLKLTSNYENIKILVVTTQKEEYEKEKYLYLQDDLKEDINNNTDIKKMITKYNKILSTMELKEILKLKLNNNIDRIVENKVKNSKTTSKIVEEYIKSRKLQDKVYHMHYPNNEGIMADQLNYVLNNFDFIDESNYYYSVYNADSIPSENTIKEILNTIEKNKQPEVIQQYSAPISNWNDLSAVMKGFAIYQSNFELRYGLINSNIPNRLFYTYVVGHGMYIRVDVLKKIGGFETKYWCEDIYMSYVLRTKNIQICPIKTLELMQSPQYLSILTRQNTVWFKTSFECLKIFKDVYSKNKMINLNSLGWMIQRLRMNITWLGLPIAFLYTIIVAILNQDIGILTVATLTYLFMILLEYGSIISLLENTSKIKLGNKFKILLYTTVATTISNIGPIYSLISQKKEKYKTIR